VAVFLLSTLVELVFRRLDLTPELRAVTLIVLLGVLVISSTLWLAFRVSEIRFEFHGLLSIFAINALFGVAAVWLGSLVGNWLWQLNLSR
jgi:CrcB protein